MQVFLKTFPKLLFHILNVDQGSANFFYKVPYCNYFRFWGPKYFCGNDCHGQSINSGCGCDPINYLQRLLVREGVPHLALAVVCLTLV